MLTLYIRSISLATLQESGSSQLVWRYGDLSTPYIWLYVIADVVIWLSCMMIPFAVLWYLHHRSEVLYKWVFYLFAGFIFLCGVTHLLDAVVFWEPAYQLLGILKVFTAVLSLVTVLCLMPLLPKLLKIPSSKQLREEVEQRKHIEKRLRETEETFRTALENAPIGLCLVGPEGKWLRVNQKLCEIVGYTSEELLKMTFQDITHKDDLETDLELFHQTLRGEINGYAMEKRYIHKDGHLVWIRLSVSMVSDEVGKPRFFISQIEDVSEQRQLQERQDKLIQELKRKGDELQQIVYVTSHDLRSPLVNILGFSSELRSVCDDLKQIVKSNDSNLREKSEKIIDEDLPEILHFIESSAKRMNRLLKGLLQFSRLGRYPLNIEKIDMSRLLTEVEQGVAFNVKQKKIQINIETLPPCYGDLALLSQLFSNLIDNAIKYCEPDRPLVISIDSKSKKKFNRYTVADNGIGIDSQHQQMIFEVFHRLNPDGTDGDGLGLSLCALITERLEGSIEVESEVGVGSRFHVYLPKYKTSLAIREQTLEAAGLNEVNIA